jgi:small subunit ribosomal protein S1
VVAIGDKLKAQILEIDGTKVFLSLKRLIADPWASVASTYRVGQVISGAVSKINPFGAFVDIGNGLQGLAHISELADHKVDDPHKIVKVGEDREFRIIELAPEDHRIGLSIKALGEWSDPKKEEQKEESQKEEGVPVESPVVPSEYVPDAQSGDITTSVAPPLSE